MKNMSSVISRYNRNKLNPKQESFGFNCRKIHSCSLNDEYLPPKVVYFADVTSEANNGQNFYFGLTETIFKDRYKNHKRDAKHIKYKCNMEVIKFIWNVKNNNIKSNIQWKIVGKVCGDVNFSMCKLCLTEKLNN